MSQKWFSSNVAHACPSSTESYLRISTLICSNARTSSLKKNDLEHVTFSTDRRKLSNRYKSRANGAVKNLEYALQAVVAQKVVPLDGELKLSKHPQIYSI
jgi:hypothetical protein